MNGSRMDSLNSGPKRWVSIPGQHFALLNAPIIFY